MLPQVPDGALTRAMRLFPLVGTLVGLAGGGVYAGAVWVGLPPMLAALLAVAAMVGLTGGLHEDGLADMTDGFGAPVGRDHKMAIMRDSRIGAFGVLALIFSVALRVGAMVALADPLSVLPALMVAGGLSRAAMPLAMRLGEPARADGLGASASQADVGVARAATLIAVLFATLLALALVPPVAAAVCVALAFLVSVLVTAIARAQIGGYTGDVLGATGQMVEIAVLLALVVTLL